MSTDIERRRFAENINGSYLWYLNDLLDMLDQHGMEEYTQHFKDHGMHRWYPEEIFAMIKQIDDGTYYKPKKEAQMSLIKQASVQRHYDLSLDTMKQLIANDLGVPVGELSVQYVEGDVGPGDPMDRYPAPRGIVGIKVTHTVK